MSTYKYAVRSTGRPFGPCERLADADYVHELSRHTSLAAAKRAKARLIADMRKHCGQDAWDNHFEVFALRNRTVTYDLACIGPGYPDPHGCPNHRIESVTLPWPVNTSCPPLPDSVPGWDSSWQCSACRHVADDR